MFSLIPSAHKVMTAKATARTAVIKCTSVSPAPLVATGIGEPVPLGVMVEVPEVPLLVVEVLFNPPTKLLALAC